MVARGVGMGNPYIADPHGQATHNGRPFSLLTMNLLHKLQLTKESNMPTPIKMPRLGESVAEGTIGSWLKNEGDWVERDESLAEIITDKINAELPSPIASRLTKILVKVDETVPVGA